jgi:hypothetical protein
LETAPETQKQRARLVPQRFLTATSVACFPEKDQQIPVLDWTDGTLRLRIVTQTPAVIPQSPGRSSLRLSHENILADHSVDPPENWQSPLRLSTIQSIGNDRAIGLATASDGTGRTIILLGRVPAKTITK